MSGQDYVYIVMVHYCCWEIDTTFPTKYQAENYIAWRLNRDSDHRVIVRYRHGDTEGHLCD